MLQESQFSSFVNKCWDVGETLSRAVFDPSDEEEHFELIRNLAGVVATLKVDCERLMDFFLQYSQQKFGLEKIE